MRLSHSHSLSLLLLSLLTVTPSSSATWSWLDDLVEELPDYGKPPTPQFSGYLNAAEGCDLATNGPLCQVHYWLALSETNSAKAPVVLWLNGGPGSSSILGFLQEQGPLLVNATGGLMPNPWSWTKYVNLLVLEAPMGVGYSYCSRQMNDGKPCVNTDRTTASASRAALVEFFTTKFPELATNPFYITGESYAGVYIPTLTKEILDHTDLNLKGIGVGDPCTDNTAQADSMDSLWYGHKYGLVDDEIYDVLWNHCNVRLPNLMARGGLHHVIHQFNTELTKIDNLQDRRRKADEFYHDIVLNGVQEKMIQESPECTLAFRKYLMSSSHGLSQGWKDLYIDDYSLFAPVSSLEDEQMATYMNRDDVRKALHVQEAPTTTWPYASVGFDYTKEYDACNWGDDILLNISMIDIYKEVVPKLERTWIYNGDTDPCVSYEGTRLAVKQIGVDELDGGGYRPWFYNQTAATMEVLMEKAALFGPNLVAQNMGAQFGGEVVDYADGLSFVTFHGSGHMVPQFRPQAALQFLKSLINGNMLSPLLPNNATMTKLSDKDFQEAMEIWTEKARGPPYVDHVVHHDEDEFNTGEHASIAMEY
jgi:serine carboxypeptidase-like clade 1